MRQEPIEKIVPSSCNTMRTIQSCDRSKRDEGTLQVMGVFVEHVRSNCAYHACPLLLNAYTGQMTEVAGAWTKRERERERER